MLFSRLLHRLLQLAELLICLGCERGFCARCCSEQLESLLEFGFIDKLVRRVFKLDFLHAVVVKHVCLGLEMCVDPTNIDTAVGGIALFKFRGGMNDDFTQSSNFVEVLFARLELAISSLQQGFDMSLEPMGKAVRTRQAT